MADDTERSKKKSSDDLLREAKEGFGTYDPAPRGDRPGSGGSEQARRSERSYETPASRIDRTRYTPPPTPGTSTPTPVPSAPQNPKPFKGSGCLASFLLVFSAIFWLSAVITIAQGDDEPVSLLIGTIVITIIPLFFAIRLLLRRKRART